MSTPETPTPTPAPITLPAPPAPKGPSALSKLLTWAMSPAGRKDIGALVAALTAIYTALHRAGV